MLAQWETSLDTLRNERSELTGLIRVAVPVGVGQTILATIASRFVGQASRGHHRLAIDGPAWRSRSPAAMISGSAQVRSANLISSCVISGESTAPSWPRKTLRRLRTRGRSRTCVRSCCSPSCRMKCR